MANRLAISLVIPAYNEENHLAACLEAALRQDLPFAEVLVIDNNSTDDTAAIARRFPHVTVLQEARQGVVFARDRGFNAAHGLIIARIDADTILPIDWTAQLQTIFMDENVDAVSGSMHYYDMALPRMIDGIDLFFRRYFARVLGKHVYMQGANMAVRKTVWRRVKHDVCHAKGLHEDLDLAVHAAEADFTVRFEERLEAGIGYRQGESNFVDFCKYACSTPKTYKYHGLKRYVHMYPAVGMAIGCAWILKGLHRGYNPVTGKFSFALLMSAEARWRVNPASFVD